MKNESGDDKPFLRNVGKAEMVQILDALEDQGDETEYVVMDVRGEDEVAYTGKLSNNVHTLPLPIIMEYDVFSMEENEFEEICGFKKPNLDETLVFSCAM